MLSENDKQLLLRNLNLGEIVLVLGAGFSLDCKNEFGNNLPNSKTLAAIIWDFLYTEPYDGSNLKTVYGAALKNRKGTAALRTLLRQHLYAKAIPDWYKLITQWHWYRIYSFNADNVIEQLYEPEGLDRIVAPAPFVERDQFLRKIQYIKLHGSLDDDQSLVFSTREYAKRATSHYDLWYQHFVEDYSTYTVIFVGTELDEPLFFQHVEARGRELGGAERIRLPRCFLVKPTISKPLEEQLEEYRIFPVRATAKDFFEWLQAQQAPPSRADILRRTHSNLGPAIEAAVQHRPLSEVRILEEFLAIFEAVRRPPVVPRGRNSSMFLLGSPPNWADIAAGLDAEREFNTPLKDLIEQSVKYRSADVIRISSPAGGGKSTAMMRTALSLIDDGHRVYFSDGSSRPDPDAVVNFCLSAQDEFVLFFDSAPSDLPDIAYTWERLKGFHRRPLFVVAARSNDLAQHGHEFESHGARVVDVEIPDMSDRDIDAVIATLDRNDLLGKLKEKSPQDRHSIFKEKSKQQILVAMREATSGFGFDEILRDEFAKLKSDDAKLLYLIAALAADDDFGLTRQFVIGALGQSPADAIVTLNKTLNGILVPHGDRDPTYSIRHPAIGQFITGMVERTKLAEAIIALQGALWGVMPTGREKKRSRAFTLYRRLLNHTYIQSKFPRGDAARGIYEAIRPLYRDDGHFWLQYASYEIESGGNLTLAENYLHQAEGLLGKNSRQVQTAMAHLLFLKALAGPNAAQALSLVDEALSILRSHMAEPSSVSWHALHIFGDQMRAYIWKWIPTMERSQYFARVHEEMRRAIPESMKGHKLLQATLMALKRAELETVVRQR